MPKEKQGVISDDTFITLSEYILKGDEESLGAFKKTLAELQSYSTLSCRPFNVDSFLWLNWGGAVENNHHHRERRSYLLHVAVSSSEQKQKAKRTSRQPTMMPAE